MNATKADLTTIVPGLKFTTDFVPWSKSRNAAEKRPSLNWLVKFTNGKRVLSTDYMQGIGHLPGFNQQDKTTGYAAICKNAAECGILQGKRAAPPDAADVMQSLLGDAEAIDYGSYEEYAADMGMDEDSRAGEAAYNACVKLGLTLRVLIGEAAMGKMRELLSDL